MWEYVYHPYRSLLCVASIAVFRCIRGEAKVSPTASSCSPNHVPTLHLVRHARCHFPPQTPLIHIDSSHLFTVLSLQFTPNGFFTYYRSRHNQMNCQFCLCTSFLNISGRFRKLSRTNVLRLDSGRFRKLSHTYVIRLDGSSGCTVQKKNLGPACLCI